MKQYTFYVDDHLITAIRATPLGRIFDIGAFMFTSDCYYGKRGDIFSFNPRYVTCWRIK